MIKPWISLLLAQIVPATVFAVLKDRAAERPFVALMMFCAYEAAVFILAFSNKVYRELEPRLVAYVADGLTAYAHRWRPGFTRKYNRTVASEHAVLNVRGLNLINAFALEVEQVFVQLAVAATEGVNRSVHDPLRSTYAASGNPVWDFIRALQKDITTPRCLAIIGPPGCGKTTLLQHVALAFATGRHRRHRVRSLIPVFLFLRDHGRAITESAPVPSLGSLLQAHFGAEGSHYPTPPAYWFTRQLDSGHLIILLDGLDEIADSDARYRVGKWIDEQVQFNPKTIFIVTARPQGYREAALQRARVLEVQPFSAEQGRSFIRGWYLANELNTATPQSSTQEIERRARSGATDLIERLRLAPALGALTVNPLLLTMIAMVHRYRGALPRSRAELYGEIAEVLLSRWRQAKGVPDVLTSAQTLVVLRSISSHMMLHRLRDIGAADAAHVIADPLARVGYSAVPADFLASIQHNSGIFLEREAGRWSFAHLTFQEYLAASELVTKPSLADLGTLVNDAWWHETLRLYAALGDATAILRECLKADTIDALALAADCVNEAREADPAVAKAVVERVIADLESPDPARRRLAAEVHLLRRLKTLQRIDQGREIDVTPLTWGEYLLFGDGASGGAGLPDHCTPTMAARLPAHQSAVGVRASDVADFCSWLGRRSGAAATFRLPTVEECREFPLPTEARVWALAGNTVVLEPACVDEEIRRVIAKKSIVPAPKVTDLGQVLQTDVVADVKTIQRAINLELDFDLAAGLQINVTVARPIIQGGARLLAMCVARPLAPELGLTCRNVARYDGLFLTRNIRRALAQETDSIGRALGDGRWPEALGLLRNVNSQAEPVQRVTRLAVAMTEAARADDADRRAYARIYVATLLEMCMLGHEVATTLSDRTVLGRAWHSLRGSQATMGALSRLHWWLHVTAARELGELPAWEGVRLVREYGATASPS